MRDARTGIVDIVRDFLVAHERLQTLFSRYREGALRFDEVAALVDDRDSSVLYRLKERCHSIFRRDEEAGEFSMSRDALFDFAVGSLFHAAMGMREAFYQREVYLPRVQRLRGHMDAGSDRLFEDFERLLEASSARMDQTFADTEELLGQTRRQLRLLIRDRRDDGLIARCLHEHEQNLEAVFGEDVDSLFRSIYGEAVEGYVAAAHSYLESACFSRASGVLALAAQRAPERDEIRGWAAYAEGMQGFLEREYERSIDRLECWIAKESSLQDIAALSLARAAISRVHKLRNGDEGTDLLERSEILAATMEERIRSLQPLVDVEPERVAK